MWFRPPVRAVWRSLPLLPALAALAGPAGATESLAERFASLASAAWSAAGVERLLAVRPLDADATGLPRELAADLDAALAAALRRAAPDAGRLVDRAGLPSSWEEASIFAGSTAEASLRAAAVEVLLVPGAHLIRDGAVLHATLVGVGGRDTGRLLAALPSVVLPGPDARPNAQPSPEAARAAGTALAEALRRDLDPAGRFRIGLRFAGERSPFGDWFLGQVGERLAARLAERPRYVSRPLRNDGRSLTVRLEAEAWDRVDRVDVNLRAVAGLVEARTVVAIPMASVPPSFLPLTDGGGRLGAGLLIADGAATTGPDLRRDEIGAAAEIAARALIVEDALDMRDPMPAVVSSRAEVATAWRRLSLGVPFGGEWTGVATGPDAAARRLQARVAAIGGPSAPALAAALDRDVYRDGDRPRVTVDNRHGTAHVAVYLWRVGGGVSRIAPAAGDAAAVVAAGSGTALPRPGDPDLVVAPAPGVEESLEAVVLVASADPYRPDRLAPLLGARQSAGRAGDVSAGDFLERVAALDGSRLQVMVFPYRVRRGD